MVSYIFLDSEQLLTYAFPPKNAKKYPKKIFLGHPTDFRGLIRPLNIFFLTRSKRYSYHKYGIGIYIEFHHRLWGRFFWWDAKEKSGGNFCPPPRHLRVKGKKDENYLNYQSILIRRLKKVQSSFVYAWTFQINSC